VDDLIAFLRARLDEDEQAIRTWESACWHLEACNDTGGYLERFDERRMLAEVEAKRRLIDVLRSYEPDTEWDTQPDIGQRANNVAGALRRLAQLYSEHPDYRPEWRPTE